MLMAAKSLSKGFLDHSSSGPQLFSRSTPTWKMRTKRVAITSILTTFASQSWICAAAYHRKASHKAFVNLPHFERCRGNCHRGFRDPFAEPTRNLQQRSMVSTFPNDDSVTMNGEEWRDVLPYEKSAHNSATIAVPEGPNPLYDRATFRSRLQGTCEVLRELGKSSVWVQVPMSRASLIEEMSSLGFEYHHAQGNTAKLNLWLREDTESMVPEFATHHVGVGAVVINSRKEILCVRELRRNYMPWKVPGGLSELGESIADAAEREVLEETGIPCTFHSILSFRHAHGLANGRSDLYFVCRLDPIEEVDENGNAVIPEPCAQASEIEATQWVPLSEYRAMVDGTDGQPGHPMMSNIMKVYDEGIRIKQKEIKSVVPGRKPNPLYMPVVVDSDYR